MEQKIVRENIEWCQIWIPDAQEENLPIRRVLLVGDSIAMAYGPKVAEQLHGVASVARLGTSRFPADPAFRDEVLMVLRHTNFDIIQFNNGLHGFDNSDAEYALRLPGLLEEFHNVSEGARWMLATSTPMRTGKDLQEWHPNTERIKERNRVLHDIAAEWEWPVTDLFSAVGNRSSIFNCDGIHHTDEGQELLAEAVTQNLRRELEKFPRN